MLRGRADQIEILFVDVDFVIFRGPAQFGNGQAILVAFFRTSRRLGTRAEFGGKSVIVKTGDVAIGGQRPRRKGFVLFMKGEKRK